MAFCAVVFGIRTARASARRDPVHGGPVAALFHLLGAVAFVGLAPGVLCGLVLGVAHSLVPVAIVSVIVSLLSFYLYAVFERPARAALPAAANDERGWTAEDARRSGL